MTGTAPAPERGLLTEGAWERLLDFLDPSRRGKDGVDRDAEAEARYLEMVRRLVCFFAGRGCRDAEDLAIESVLRVAAKCGEVDASAYQDRAGFFYGVARNVLHEWWRDAQRESTRRESFRRELSRLGVPNPQSWRRKEAVHRCLELCLRELSQRARRLIVRYYGEQGVAKIESHRRLADESGKSVNALRIEVHRIRSVLRECVVGCMAPRGGLGREVAASG
jgi:RNA polymerase sigma factor (sigma-70 family)